MKKILAAFVYFLFLCFATSCQHKDPVVEDVLPSDLHTLLIYMVGDNNGMSRYCEPNIRSCIEGLKQTDPTLNIVIYKDVENHFPELFLLRQDKKNAQKIDTIYIKKYTEYVNSVDPDFMASVVNLVFSECPGKIKGLELWSHGGSWIPDGWSPENTQPTRASQYIGIDNHRYMQLWELREALEKCPHLDYITFDACNMATAEVAYELKDRCDYVLASAQEIMGDGFPYKTMMGALSQAYQTGVEPALRICVDLMQKLYPTNGSLSLIKCAEMDALANAYSQLLHDNATLLEALEENADAIQQGWQHYGGGYATNTIYYYYDLEEVAEYLQGDLVSQIHAAVPYSYHADSYYSTYDGRHAITRFCGIAVSVPEVFLALAKGNSYLSEGYHMTRWGQKMGY